LTFHAKPPNLPYLYFPQVLTAIAVQLLKQGEKHNEIILQGKGLNRYSHSESFGSEDN